MLLANDVIAYPGPPSQALRILWIDRERALAWVFALRQERALPRQVELGSLVRDVQDGRARLLPTDPYAAARPAGTVPPAHAALQARALDAVQSLHAGLPALYQQRERAALLSAYADAHGVSRATLMRYLRRWWERGQTPEALLPDYANSGARGRTRMANAGVKRGRPRKGLLPGANADARMRAIFVAAAARYAATHEVFSRRAAYRQMLADYFHDAEPGVVPSYGQFRYWLERDAQTLPPGAGRRSAP
ncbi:hypothetical protein B0920_01290 [Massilia sp. KIM]|uniref:hypothetical protein n=1 Tax=Massilia sp. KIM TaxID=1955422 RepID=UPI00098F1BC0|nr:hypothetical protein [Massilia sp. KIM]OON62156.1 hypothetical protein B0920_01290 [Massilia sp. KIM]